MSTYSGGPNRVEQQIGDILLSLGEEVLGVMGRMRRLSDSGNAEFDARVTEIESNRIGSLHVRAIDYTVITSERTKTVPYFVIDLSESLAGIFPSNGRLRDPYFPNTSHGIFPLGPVSGLYARGNPGETRFLFYTSNGQQCFGPYEVVDRFPSSHREQNQQYSGGLVLVDGKIQITNQDGVRIAKENRLPSAQLFYTFGSNNLHLLSQQWTHFGRDMMIGDSVGAWSMYVQSPEGMLYLTPRYSLFRRSASMLALHHMMRLLEEVGGSNWICGLTDSALGGGFVAYDATEDMARASSVREFTMMHSAPAVLIAR